MTFLAISKCLNDIVQAIPMFKFRQLKAEAEQYRSLYTYLAFFTLFLPSLLVSILRDKPTTWYIPVPLL